MDRKRANAYTVAMKRDTASPNGSGTRCCPMLRLFALAAGLLLSLGMCRTGLAGDAPVWEPVIARLTADGQNRAAMVRLFTGLAFDPSIMAHKVDAMVKKEFEPQPKPGRRTLEQSAYRQFLSPAVIGQAVAFIRENRAAFVRAKTEFGPPPELIAAIMLVETQLGSFLGEQNALAVLASLARSADLATIQPFMKTLSASPERQAFAANAAKDRADWGYRELLALIRLSATNHQDPTHVPGSIYGAIGLCQFMPSNVLTYGVDGNGDGKVDLFSPADAICSVASYLRGHGWRPGLTDDEARAVVYSYNHSDLYVLAVLTVAARIHDRLGAF